MTSSRRRSRPRREGPRDQNPRARRAHARRPARRGGEPARLVWRESRYVRRGPLHPRQRSQGRGASRPRPRASVLRDVAQGAGAPAVGPVFPVTKGKRKGEAKGKATYARPLAASSSRTPASPGTRCTTTRRRAAGPNCTRCGRYGYDTALGEAGVNAQHAMHLSGHADPKVHQRYVMATEAMRTVPVGRATPDPGRRSRCRLSIDWGKRLATAETKSGRFSERDTGFEPATSSLGSWHSTN